MATKKKKTESIEESSPSEEDTQVDGSELSDESAAKETETVIEDVEQQKEVQLLLKVTRDIKDKAQKQADLAYQYGWIETPTVKQLFVWVVSFYLDAGIKAHIKSRATSPVQEGRE